MSKQSFCWPVSSVHMAGSGLELFKVMCFFKVDPWPSTGLWAHTICKQGWVVQKQVDANPRLKINRIIDFPCIQMFSITFVLCILKLFKTQNRKPNNIQKSSSSILIGLWTTRPRAPLLGLAKSIYYNRMPCINLSEYWTILPLSSLRTEVARSELLKPNSWELRYIFSDVPFQYETKELTEHVCKLTA